MPVAFVAPGHVRLPRPSMLRTKTGAGCRPEWIQVSPLMVTHGSGCRRALVIAAWQLGNFFFDFSHDRVVFGVHLDNVGPIIGSGRCCRGRSRTAPLFHDRCCATLEQVVVVRDHPLLHRLGRVSCFISKRRVPLMLLGGHFKPPPRIRAEHTRRGNATHKCAPPVNEGKFLQYVRHGHNLRYRHQKTFFSNLTDSKRGRRCPSQKRPRMAGAGDARTSAAEISRGPLRHDAPRGTTTPQPPYCTGRPSSDPSSRSGVAG